MRKVVVIGGSAAGMMAAISAAVYDSNADVTVVSRDLTAYRRPGIPALVAGYISDPAGAGVFAGETLGQYKIRLICPAEVTNINVKTKTVSVQGEGKIQELGFDSAVIATGGYPIIPKIPGSEKKGVYTFTTFEGAQEIVEATREAETAVVVGAGFVALEIAESLMHKGLDVYFNVRSRILRKIVEPDVSEFLSRRFDKSGLKMLIGEAISEVGGAGSVEYVVHKSKKISTKVVIMGTGVKPSVSLAEKCGIALGSSGAIKVDNRMQTSVADIYAAGDCAESPDLGTGRFVYSPVGSIGAMAGRIAGANAAGGNEESKGFLRAQTDEILGMQIFSIGHSTTTAKEVNLAVTVRDLRAPVSGQDDRGAGSFETGKLLTDIDNRIVGAQLVSVYHGSQYAWQLYQAVLRGKDREKFLKEFNSPRRKFTETMLATAGSTISVENVGDDNALRWQNKLCQKQEQ
ncbi:MAG: hypothetical protein DRP65_03195 [Planctomycetota bacterium]|nr:MAG: hypothetical protein DRP65_03195 [Planctomycetota bacterium]